MKKFLLFLIILIPISFSLMPVSSLQYDPQTEFTLTSTTKLRDGTGQYSGYTEDETEIRDYRIVNQVGDVVYWSYHRNWDYKSNEGDRLSDDNTYEFQTSVANRSYLQATHDGDTNYYTFDKIWFRIDPQEAAVGQVIHILGYDYVSEGQVSIMLTDTRQVDVIKMSLVGSGNFQVLNTDYDPDTILDVSFTNTYYYDINTGYLVMEKWNADAYTSVGNFKWYETTKLTSSTFLLQERHIEPPFLSRFSFLDYLVFVSSLALIIVIFFRLPPVRKYFWRKDVRVAMAILAGEYTFEEDLKQATTLWDPLSIPFTELLEKSGKGAKFALKDGVYIVMDTDKRLAFVDVNQDHRIPTQILSSRDQNLKIVYRLALGSILKSSEEATRLMYLIQPFLGNNTNSEFAPVDGETLRIYKGTRYSPQEMDVLIEVLGHKAKHLFENVEILLSRRKLLDYTYGQAPLSPYSHIRKLVEVMKFNPKHVLLVGDDDLLSVSLSRLDVKVTVVEIDPYTCALISGISDKENLGIDVFQIDLRDPLPKAIPNDFNLFVADPDFTIEAFGLFLARGMSQLKVGGIGLINFENTTSQRYKVEELLRNLNVKKLHSITEPWNYTILRNERKATGVYTTGKYTSVNYTEDIVLATAQYSSVMYVLEKSHGEHLLLSPEDKLSQSSWNSIYDFEE